MEKVVTGHLHFDNKRRYNSLADNRFKNEYKR